jgi:hypothetical protein
LRINKKSNYSVVTGDLIGSSKLNPNERKKLHFKLKRIYKQLISDFPVALPLPIDIFRGDSWQFIIANPVFALRISLCFRLLIKSEIYLPNIDTRMSLAIGKISFLSKNRISESDGEAFRISGQKLENMKSTARLIIYIPSEKLSEPFQVITELTDFIISRYTGKQSLAVYGMLAGMGQEEITKLWKPRISQQMVSKHLKSAGSNTIEKAVDFFEHNIKRL